MKPYLLFALFIFLAPSAFARFVNQDYHNGAYYTLDGKKHTGLLAVYFNPPALFRGKDNHFYFKPDLTVMLKEKR
ncbi:hypothetical protein ABZR88_14610 [Mucilaginibacter yixingensis]|nr:hypothetical protein [Mucilaginibacter yixingensis]